MSSDGSNTIFGILQGPFRGNSALDALGRVVVATENRDLRLVPLEILQTSSSGSGEKGSFQENDIVELTENELGGVETARHRSDAYIQQLSAEKFQRLFTLVGWGLSPEKVCRWLSRFSSEKLADLTTQQVELLLESDHEGLRRLGIRASQFRKASSRSADPPLPSSP